MALVELAQAPRVDVARLLDRYGLTLELVAPEERIPGSVGAGREARVRYDRLYARLDTPLHSILHEAARHACMSPERRAGLDAAVAGAEAEEGAVRYLQVVLADHIRFFGRARMLEDMDAAGPSFGKGSVRTWFESDAGGARDWLRAHELIDERAQPTWKLRE
jgi:hypothetical protein